MSRGRRGGDTDRPGWRIAGYEAQELIGFGATGEVWRGRAVGGAAPVALKRLSIADPAAAAALRREAALLQEVAHPHLLRVRELVDDAAGPVLVLDYAAGGSLAALLRARGRMRPGEVVTAIAPIAAALAHTHAGGLVHGDVSPGNILFTDDGRPLLADFGVARAAAAGDDPPAPGRPAAGPTAQVADVTPEYADPLVLRGASPGPASDVFSLAAVTFHALAGIPPWNAATVDDTLGVAAYGEPPDLAELAPEAPAAMIEAVLRGLALDPVARGTAADFTLDVRHACPPDPVRLPARTSTVVPDSARPAELTHSVLLSRSPGSTDGDGARHRSASTERRSLTRAVASVTGRVLRVLRPVLQSRGLRAAALGLIGVVVAVRIGMAWAGAGAPVAAPAADAGPTAAPTLRPSQPSGGAVTPPVLPAPPASAPPAPRRSGRLPPRPATTSPHPASRSRPHPASPMPSTGAAPSRWRSVLTGLDVRRASAFASADPVGLAAVYLPRTRAGGADERTVAALSAAGERVVGARHTIGRITAVSLAPDRAVLQVDQALTAYDVLRPPGRAQHHPASPARHYRLTLVDVGGRWRIADLVTVAAGAPT